MVSQWFPSGVDKEGVEKERGVRFLGNQRDDDKALNATRSLIFVRAREIYRGV